MQDMLAGGNRTAVQLAPSRFSGHHQRRRSIWDQRCGRPTLCLSDDARSRRGARESRVEVVLGFSEEVSRFLGSQSERRAPQIAKTQKAHLTLIP
jgi:hypothetical protein